MRKMDFEPRADEVLLRLNCERKFKEIIISVSGEMVRVTVSEGILEGEEVANEYDSGKIFCSFKGIPYAEPPLGDLRFKAPQPPKPWTGVRSAKDFGPMCYQFDMFNHFAPQGSEDCLYLNVYTPTLKPSQPLPVMFWIHGGGFVSGSGDDNFYAPEYLLKKDVVLVTINYRLEILGFLCLDTEDVPGNAGMKDQVAALRWVSKNIRNFGGDPDNITIFGESAGAGSVGYHLVSPMTKGLFRNAILQSGASTCWWSYVTEPKERALALARKLGFRAENDKELYEFFKAQPVESLIMQQTSAPLTFAQKEKSSYEPGFVIVNEKKFGNNERFFYGDFSFENLTKNIHDDVQVFMGLTKDEGLICLNLSTDLEKKCDQMSSFLEEFVPKPIAYSCSVPQQLEVGRKLKEFYFNKRDIKTEDWEQVVKFYSAEFFHYGLIEMAKMIASLGKNKVYFYQLSCISERNQFANYLGLATLIKDKPVVSHCDDLLYLFSGKLFTDHCKNPDTIQLVDKVTAIWTNIAKYGNPTPDESLGVKWPPYSLEKQEYLDIGNQLAIGTALHELEIQLWESIFREYAPDFVHK